nr:hypothetical protein [Massilia glaciei]
MSTMLMVPSIDSALNSALAAQHLDPFDQFGRERVEREAGRGPLAVDQDLGVAAAKAAHAHVGAARGHAGQPPEHVDDIGIAVFDDLVVADDDHAGGGGAPRIAAGRRAAHLDLFQPRRRGAGARVRRGIALLGPRGRHGHGGRRSDQAQTQGAAV